MAGHLFNFFFPLCDEWNLWHSRLVAESIRDGLIILLDRAHKKFIYGAWFLWHKKLFLPQVFMNFIKALPMPRSSDQ
jgi:hypothetical protein